MREERIRFFSQFYLQKGSCNDVGNWKGKIGKTII